MKINDDNIMRVIRMLLELKEKARRNGLLALSEELKWMQSQKEHSPFNPFYFCLKAVVDGTSYEDIRTWMSNMRLQLKTNDELLLFRIIEEGCLAIQRGDNETKMAFLFATLLPKRLRNSITFIEDLKKFNVDIE
jgi:flagellar motor component MotA